MASKINDAEPIEPVDTGPERLRRQVASRWEWACDCNDGAPPETFEVTNAEFDAIRDNSFNQILAGVSARAFEMIKTLPSFYEGSRLEIKDD